MRTTDQPTPASEQAFREPLENGPLCVTLIGMPGSGKTTLGRVLSEHLGWMLMDTDNLMEAWWGLPLQALRDELGLDGFLLAEEKAVLSLCVNRCVISTGGSVVYSGQAMARLKELGPVVHLDACLPVITRRVAACPDRGLAMQEDQSLADLFEERAPLYLQYADYRVCTDRDDSNTCAIVLRDWLKEYEEKQAP